jgi:hypothetical protein
MGKCLILRSERTLDEQLTSVSKNKSGGLFLSTKTRILSNSKIKKFHLIYLKNVKSNRSVSNTQQYSLPQNQQCKTGQI